MICKEFKKRVWDYLDGRIRPAPAEKCNAHLQECPRCREMLARAEKLLELLPAAAPPDPGPAYLDSFWPRLREKMLEQKKTIRSRSFIRLNPLYYAALGTAAAALVLWVSSREPDSIIFPPTGTADFVLATAAGTSGTGNHSVDYVSTTPSGGIRRGRSNTNYMLSGTSQTGNARFEV